MKPDLALLFDGYPDPVCTLDKTASLSYYNPALLQKMILKDSILGKQIDAVFPNTKYSLVSGQLDDGVYSLDINNRHFRVTTSTINSPNPNFTSLLIFSEITPEYEANEDLVKKINELDMLINSMFTSLPENIFWQNTEGVILKTNLKQAQLLGFNRVEEVIGKHPTDLLSQKEAKEIMAVLTKIVTTGNALVLTEKLTFLNKSHTMLSYKIPLRHQNGEVQGILGFSIDISEKKQIEELYQAKEKAEAANQAKTEFIANMSHDLRTPLTGMIGMASILQAKIKNPEEQRDAHRLQESAQRLLSLCNSILEVVSIGNITEANIKRTDFDLGQEILDICRLEMPALKVKAVNISIQIEPAIPRYIITDKIKLQCILLNLLGNAIKFTEKGFVVLKVKKLKRRQNKLFLEFKITDTGIGISEEFHHKIFERFYRISPSYKGKYSGYGVGLSLVRHYVELLGGKIHLESIPGEGSTFSFTLPVEVNVSRGEVTSSLGTASFYQELAELTAPGLSHVDANKKTTLLIKPDAPRLLLVEDDPTALHIVKFIAEREGCQVTAVTSGEEGIELVASTQFDLIISDIGLPGISGIEMTKQIRALETNSHQKPVPIVALTGHAAEMAEQKCLQVGMNKVFTKPMSVETLQALLAVYTQSAKKALPDIKALASNDLPTEKSNLFKLEKFPLLDVELAKEQLGGHLPLLIDSLIMLIETFPQDKAAIVQAYESDDWEAVEKLAHRMKGGAVYCGASRMVFACQYLERYRKAERDGELLPRLYEQLLPVLEETEQSIRSWLEANNFNQ